MCRNVLIFDFNKTFLQSQTCTIQIYKASAFSYSFQEVIGKNLKHFCFSALLWFTVSRFVVYNLQSYQQRMRLQRRLCGIYTINNDSLQLITCISFGAQSLKMPKNLYLRQKTLFNLRIVIFKEFQVVFKVPSFVGNLYMCIVYSKIYLYCTTSLIYTA